MLIRWTSEEERVAHGFGKVTCGPYEVLVAVDRMTDRCLDHDFPGLPIDYRIAEPSPYKSEEEFLWFVE